MFLKRWTPDRQNILIDLWNKGLSTGQIARELGETRSGIAGMVWRLRAKQPGAFMAHAKPKPPKPVATRYKPVIPRPQLKPVVAPSEPQTAGVSLFKLAVDGCRYIVSSDYSRNPTHLYCGVATADEDIAYCPFHNRLMHVPIRH